MYEMLIDGKSLYYPGDSECTVLSPEIIVKMNDAGQAQMSVPTINPLYNAINLRKSMLTVKKNGNEIFYGEVRAYERDFDLSRKLTAVGALSFLYDSIQPQYNYGNVTHLQFLTSVLSIHNTQMGDDDRKKIYVGNVTVANTSNTTDKITDDDETLNAIRSNLIDVYGGVLRLRHSSGRLYLDYINLSEYGNYCNQGITLGENLMDYIENYSAESICTVVKPRGARITDDSGDGFEKRVDITSVNGGSPLLAGNATAIEKYGKIVRVITYDGIDSPATLKTAAQTYLRETQFENAIFKLSAADLAAVEADINAIYFGDRINVKVPIFGLDETYPIVEMTYKPHNPEDERITVSANIRNKKSTLTGRVGSISSAITMGAVKEAQKIAQVLRAEIANIMATFAGQYGGYKLEEYDENGLWLRTLMMDAPDKDDAVNILEFSMRGIRGSTGGYKAATDPAWKLAITLDGKIASQEVLSNIIIANLLKVGIIQDVARNSSWNLETGALSSKKLSITSTNFTLQEDGSAEMTNAVINDGTVTTRGTKTISGIVHHKETIVESGILTGIDNDRQTGILDLAASYADNREHVVLQSEQDLHLQSGDPTNGGMDIIIDRNGIHPQGLSGAYQLQSGETLELDGGLIVDFY